MVAESKYRSFPIEHRTFVYFPGSCSMFVRGVGMHCVRIVCVCFDVRAKRFWYSGVQDKPRAVPWLYALASLTDQLFLADFIFTLLYLSVCFSCLFS